MSSELAQSLRTQMISFIDELPAVMPADYEVRFMHCTRTSATHVFSCSFTHASLLSLCQLASDDQLRVSKRGKEWASTFRQPTRFPQPDVATNMFITTNQASRERIEEVRGEWRLRDWRWCDPLC